MLCLTTPASHLLLLAEVALAAGLAAGLAAPDQAAEAAARAGGHGLGAGAGSAGLQSNFAVNIKPGNELFNYI